MSREMRELVEKWKDIEKSAFGRRIFDLVKREAERERTPDVIAAVLVEDIRPVIDAGGIVFLDEIHEEFDDTELEMLKRVSRVSRGLRRYIGAWQLMKLMEIAEG